MSFGNQYETNLVVMQFARNSRIQVRIPPYFILHGRKIVISFHRTHQRLIGAFLTTSLKLASLSKSNLHDLYHLLRASPIK